jgi:SAM-dependent methyltransferase
MNKAARQSLKRTIGKLPGGGHALNLLVAVSHLREVGLVKSPEQLFTRYYETNKWGVTESLSGPGSTLEYTKNIRAKLPELIERLDVRSMLDVPCGDYNWFQHVERADHVQYIGADIVRPLVDANRAKYANSNTSFEHLDVTKDRLPRVDLVLCRDLLFHLPNRKALEAVDNILASGCKWLLTTSHIDCDKNYDIMTGSFRLINLELEPFSFGPAEFAIEDWVEGSPPRYLGLWPADHLRRRLHR